VENVVEVRYAGVGIGRSTVLRDWNATGAFLGFAEPMPTGTPLVLKGDGIDQAARVVETIESVDLAVAGMRVEFVDSADPLPRPAPAVAAPAAPAEASPGADPSLAEAAPASADEGPPVADADSSGVTEAQHATEGEAGSNAGSGKRRRRRK
jgi:hypothetical protein